MSKMEDIDLLYEHSASGDDASRKRFEHLIQRLVWDMRNEGIRVTLMDREMEGVGSRLLVNGEDARDIIADAMGADPCEGCDVDPGSNCSCTPENWDGIWVENMPEQWLQMSIARRIWTDTR